MLICINDLHFELQQEFYFDFMGVIRPPFLYFTELFNCDPDTPIYVLAAPATLGNSLMILIRS